LERIEYIIPEQWKSGLISWNQLIDQIEKDISKELKTGIHPMTKRLLTIRGIGDMTAAKLQAYIDSSRFDSPSKLNRYCGLDPQFSKRKKGMSAADAKKCGNAYLKKELLGITADGFVKHRTPVYRDLYDSEKKKEIELAKQFGCGVQVPNNGGKTTVKTETHYEKDEKNGGMKAVNGHADSRARKAMMQLFIQHYWAVEREVLGLPTRSPYVQEHLGHTGIIKPQW
jgi:DNA polymerase/3'-5' exonuclease PolX